MLTKARKDLQNYFGYSSFRPGQEKVISNVLERKRNSACIMPTGGGKSICYQIPALQLPGTTLVISPLISLMKDQVDALNVAGIPASYINSSLSYQEMRIRLSETKQGRYKLLYIAPERLQSPEFLQEIKQLEIPLIAVDEAHCISQWGHDFRPSYMNIKEMLNALPGDPVILALTATATPQVSDDICRLLHIDASQVVSTGFARSNLSFQLVKGEDKMRYLENYIKTNKDESGIIYTATRKEADRISQALRNKGIRAGRYHAGMNDEERLREQEDFLQDNITIMVATSAFGMGIDKSNIRYVIHYQMPKDMESYYQEAGRAGRDGADSECILLYSAQDVQIQRFLIEQSTTNESRQIQQLEKLRQMMDYCHTEGCLQAFILRYFGEQSPEDCGQCSSCTDERELTDVTREAQMVMSCLIRMGARFGKTFISQVLTGSRNKKVVEAGFDKLTTYGMMKDKSLQEVNEFIEFLTSELYLGATTGQYPTLYVTEKGKEVLLGKSGVERKARMQTSQLVEDDELFNHLRAVRKSIAEEENVPPFVVFSDVTLRDMCAKLPDNPQDFLNVKGVGEQKRQRYGERFIEEIQTFCAENPDRNRKSEAVMTSKPSKKRTPTDEPSHLETYKMFQEGMSIKELAEAREITEETAGSHLLRSISEGHSIDWERIITSQIEAQIKEAVEKVGKEKLKPLKENVSEEISYFLIKLTLEKWRQESGQIV
ncbi:DNA helicase RecQ [Bacillus gobiensis]|uniref:DNA helicase RecQ n=1 Tax=Bacillus gobiensis TaxID=1441095 RepID=UPI003D208860